MNKGSPKGQVPDQTDGEATGAREGRSKGTRSAASRAAKEFKGARAAACALRGPVYI